MIRNLLTLTVISISFFACVSSEKLLTNGQYDEAITASISKIKKGGKGVDDQALILESAYQKAQQQDKEKIEFLKKENNPANLDDIYHIYERMNGRQDRIKPILPVKIKSKKRDAAIEIVDYSNDLISSKNKAVEYFYTHALQLLEKKNRTDARSAFDDLNMAKGLNSTYKDIDEQIRKAQALGTAFILYTIENKSTTKLPAGFEEEQLSHPFAELNKAWLQYDSKKVQNRKYDYNIILIIKNIQVDPDAVTKNDFTETKQVDDGFNYVLDPKGNVRKDTLGNDIKTPKFKTISCLIAETHQKKKGIISGTLDYTDNNTHQLIRSEPIVAESTFENHTATATGDLNALKPETKAKLGSNPMPFPTSLDMIIKAGIPLKANTHDIIWKNKELLF